MKRKYYAGIGSRETPLEVQKHMYQVGRFLAKAGYTLRTGGADGADAAFLEGCRSASGQVELWLPWQGFNGHRSSLTSEDEDFHRLACLMHPAWGSLKESVKKLHSRNVGQIFGSYFDAEAAVAYLGRDHRSSLQETKELFPDVSEFVLCWTPDGSTGEKTSSATGGTGTAIRIAHAFGVPVYNSNNFIEALRQHCI